MALTGMPNRRRFFSELSGLMENGGSGTGPPSRHHRSRRFKPVNDSLRPCRGRRPAEGSGAAAAQNLPRKLSDRPPWRRRVRGSHSPPDERGGPSRMRSCHLRGAVPAQCRRRHLSINVTGCIGFASLPPVSSTIEQFYERAEPRALLCQARQRWASVVVFNEGHEAELSISAGWIRPCAIPIWKRSFSSFSSRRWMQRPAAP